jgi:hypothetical protein
MRIRRKKYHVGYERPCGERSEDTWANSRRHSDSAIALDAGRG